MTYAIYCANCHGAEARGDGHLAALLTVKPTDLTRLTKKDGTFPDDDCGRPSTAATTSPATG